MDSTQASEPDEERVEQFLGQMVTDMGAAINGVLVMIGAKLGLWQAMDGAGPMTAAELAEKTGVRERYVREWLAAQAASGYVEYDPKTEAFTLPPEAAIALAEEDSPAYMAGGFHIISSAYRDWERIADRFQHGEGFGWHEHDPELFLGTEQFFRPGYRASLVADWIPALDGVQDKLMQGANVADIGCGHGVSTVLMAKAFPESEIHGFDYHAESIERAKSLAREREIERAKSLARERD